MRKQLFSTLVIAACSLALLGCSSPEPAQQTDSSQIQTSGSETVTASETSSVSSLTYPTYPSTEAPSVSEGATLYIGCGDSFREYHLDCGESATPDELIEGIADLTGWDLTLVDPVSTGKGGMTVCFSSQCALFTGPPEPQKEEFHMYSAEQLAATILDSIQATLQNYYIDPSLGDPSNLDIYYCMEDNEPLTLPNLGITIPMDQPYSGLSFEDTPESETPITGGATLYIGSNGSFREYHLDCGESATPDELIEGIADLTGWDLTLVDPVSTGKGGMTVCFSSQCALFTGPPEPQKEEFHMYSAEQLAATILDSIQATLQNYYIDPSLGDPSNLDIYYCMEDNQPLTLSNLGITIPMDQPYSGLSF